MPLFKKKTPAAPIAPPPASVSIPVREYEDIEDVNDEQPQPVLDDDMPENDENNYEEQDRVIENLKAQIRTMEQSIKPKPPVKEKPIPKEQPVQQEQPAANHYDKVVLDHEQRLIYIESLLFRMRA